MPFSSPGDLPHPGIEPVSLMSPALAGGFFATVPPGKPNECSKPAWKTVNAKQFPLLGWMSVGALLVSPVQGMNFPSWCGDAPGSGPVPTGHSGSGVPGVASLDVPLLAALLCLTTPSPPLGPATCSLTSE